MKDDEMVIRIKEDKTVKLEIFEQGKRRTKYISPQVLYECIRESVTQKETTTGLLPSNIISVRSDTNGNHYAVVECLSGEADVTYMNTVYENFPLPRLIFGFKVESSGRISAVNLGVVPFGKLTPDIQMYYYPFSNVSGFSLCTGSNALPKIKTLQALKNLPDFIISLPDNDDRYVDKNNKLKLGHRDLMEHMRNKDRQYYYDNILIPMPGKTLSNFI